jgi:hypothetical protein
VLVAVAVVAALETRTVEVAVEARRSVRVECAVGIMTRVVFPERLLTLRWSRGAREGLGARLRSTAPVGMVEVQPTRVDTSGALEAQGPSQTVIVELSVVPKGVPLEVRLVMSAARRPEELGVDGAVSTRGTALAQIPAKGSLAGSKGPMADGNGAVETTHEPSAEGSAPSSEGAGREANTRQGLSVDGAHVSSLSVPQARRFGGLLNSEVVLIGRREVQPGRRDVVLVDALQAKDWVWLRFVMPGGARDHVEGVSWDDREVDSYQVETLRRDLRLVVRIPRVLVKPESKATVRVGGGEYRFPLRAGTLRALLGGPFW